MPAVARLAGSCSAASSAWMRAWIFSQTLGTPKKAVGCTAPSVAASSAALGQKYTCPALCTGP